MGSTPHMAMLALLTAIANLLNSVRRKIPAIGLATSTSVTGIRWRNCQLRKITPSRENAFLLTSENPMLINPQDSPLKQLETLDKEMKRYREGHFKSLLLWDEVVKELVASTIDTKEVVIDYVAIYEDSLSLGMKLTEEGNFSSLEEFVKAFEELYSIEAQITDDEWSKGKTIYFCRSGEFSFFVILHGNSKCQLIVESEETVTKVVKKYRVDCGEMQPLKGIPYVTDDNTLDAPIGRLGSGENLLDHDSSESGS